MKSSSSFFLPLCIIIIFFASCNQSKTTENNKDESIHLDNLDDPLNNPALITKYNAYIALGNAVSPNVWKAYDDYLSSVDTTSGTLSQGYFKPRFSATTPHQFETIKDLRNQSPVLEDLEELGVRYIEAYENLTVPLRKLIDLKETDRLKIDSYAVLKEENPKVLKAFNAFIQIDTAMNSIIKEMADNFTNLELEKYKKDGQQIRYTHLVLIESLRDHLDYAGQFNYMTMNTIDANVFNKNTDEVLKAFDAFNESIQDKEKLEAQTRKPFMMSNFTRQIKEYIRKSNKIVEVSSNEREHKRVIDMVDRTKGNILTNCPEELNKLFSNIVRESNMVM